MGDRVAGRLRFYGGGVGLLLPPSAFEQLEECLFPEVISVSPCPVFHFSVRYRKDETTHDFLLYGNSKHSVLG